jgi:hypothetical protein
MFKNANNRLQIASLLFLFALMACDDGVSPGASVSVSLSVAVDQSAAAPVGDFATGGLAADITEDDGTHTLVITRVAMVLREVELERLSTPDCPDGVEDDDACEEFEAGPFLIELPTDGSVTTTVSVDADPDVYDEVEFEIHKPEDESAADLAFLSQHPDFEGVSIRVEGTFDGASFVFLQDLNAEQEMPLIPPLDVSEGSGPVNLTLTVDVRSWFRDETGALLDPREANKGEPFEALVEENIEASIDLFEDDDRDGESDD